MSFHCGELPSWFSVGNQYIFCFEDWFCSASTFPASSALQFVNLSWRKGERKIIGNGLDGKETVSVCILFPIFQVLFFMLYFFKREREGKLIQGEKKNSILKKQHSHSCSFRIWSTCYSAEIAMYVCTSKSVYFCYVLCYILILFERCVLCLFFEEWFDLFMCYGIKASWMLLLTIADVCINEMPNLKLIRRNCIKKREKKNHFTVELDL